MFVFHTYSVFSFSFLKSIKHSPIQAKFDPLFSKSGSSALAPGSLTKGFAYGGSTLGLHLYARARHYTATPPSRNPI
jgi:hypothetical protein